MKRTLIILAILLFASMALAATVELNFAWDRNTETDLAGYRLYYSATAGAYVKGTGSANFLQAILVSGSTHPNTTLQQISGSEGQKIYFVLTAYDLSGNESGFSNEVNYTIPDVTPPAPPKGLVATLIRIILAIINFFRGGLSIG